MTQLPLQRDAGRRRRGFHSAEEEERQGVSADVNLIRAGDALDAFGRAGAEIVSGGFLTAIKDLVTDVPPSF